MAFKALVGSLGLAAIVMTSTAALGVSSALAQANTDCTCVISPNGENPVGSITQASSGVFVTGGSGQTAAAAGTALFPNSVVTTTAQSTAAINLGASCSFGLGGSMKVQIVARGDNLCVQVINQSLPPPPPGDGLSPGVLAAIAGGGGLIVSLGFLSPASQ